MINIFRFTLYLQMVYEEIEESTDILPSKRPTIASSKPNQSAYDNLEDTSFKNNSNYLTISNYDTMATISENKEYEHIAESENIDFNNTNTANNISNKDVLLDNQANEYFKLEPMNHLNQAFSSDNENAITVDVHNHQPDVKISSSQHGQNYFILEPQDGATSSGIKTTFTTANNDNYFTLEATDDSVCGDTIKMINTSDSGVIL